MRTKLIHKYSDRAVRLASDLRGRLPTKPKPTSQPFNVKSLEQRILEASEDLATHVQTLASSHQQKLVLAFGLGEI